MTIKDALFKTKDGQYVVGQKPNWPIYLAFITWIGSQVTEGAALNTFRWGMVVSLTTWSLLEVFSGVNVFRRLLGVGILALQIRVIVDLL